MEFIAQQLFFYFAIALVLFLPGWFLLNLIEARKKYFSILEKFVISAGLSIVSVNFLLIIISKLGILINKTSVIFSIFSFILILQLIIHIIKKSCDTYPRSVKSVTEEINALKFSKNQTILIVLILFLTVFIKTAYLSNTIFPTSTDLGHHMYWSKLIAETGELPAYAKQEIISADGNYSVSRPEPIADFIIGEHLIFSAVALISGAGFISSFPSLILLLVNISSLLAVFVLALRFFAGSPGGKNIPILALFLLGPLYAISSPQAKFVSGGVIGNLLGNLLIPLVLYFFYRALTEKNSNFALLGVLCSAGVFYAHHLSALILLFALLFSLVIFSLLNFRNLLVHMKSWAGILFSKQVVGIILFLAFFALFVHLPEYFEKSAVDTAIGAPSKSTRLGLTFAQLKFSAGEPRLALALAGIIVVLASRARTFYRSAFLLGWAGSLFVMSLKPGWLFIDIPSNRIANYIVFPLCLLSAAALFWFFSRLDPDRRKIFDPRLAYPAFFLIFSAIAAAGFYDNSKSLASAPNFQKAAQTFSAAGYLSRTINEKDVLLKDHNYITADTWIKLFFMRDYNFPFSRSYFKRYADNPGREQCTLKMISAPGSAEAEKCFAGTGTNYIMVNPLFDSAQFDKAEKFWRVYAGGHTNIYHRKF